MTRAKHPSKTIMTTTRSFELLHMDLFGPTHYSTLTTTACLYGFVIVDDYSRYTWVHIILYKTEVQDVFRRFANRATNNYGAKIKHIRSDNGTEFKNTGLDTYLDTLGITHEFSAPYTPQQNGVVERKKEHSLRWPERCLMNTRLQENSGLKPLILHAIQSLVFIFTSF